MDYIANSNDLTSVANAIRTRGGTSAPLSFPSGFVSAIGAIPSGGGGGAETKSLNFYDYDGTLVESFTTSEALALSDLPANPTHTGLTAQGWNWSLANIKSYLTDYPDATVNVGQMYITDDGKTRIHITLDDPDALSPYLYLSLHGKISVDWGDNTDPEVISGSNMIFYNHTYSQIGDYVIAIDVTSGNFGFSTNNNANVSSCLTATNDSSNRRRSQLYSNAVTKINIGHNVILKTYAFNLCGKLKVVTIPSDINGIDNYAFYNCHSIESITVPNGITTISAYLFANCYLLKSVCIPHSITTIANYPFQNCKSLRSITIPDSVTSIGNSAFFSCHSLESIVIPDNVTSIGSSAFQNCYALSSITIPNSISVVNSNVFQSCGSLLSINLPDTVTKIQNNAFQDCSTLCSINIPNTVTYIGGYAFRNCYKIQSIEIPNNVTSIGNYAFDDCWALRVLIIPNSVTSIGNNAFSYCHTLRSIVVPENVVSIGSGAFSYCYGVSEYHFRSVTPPSLASNAFIGIISDTIIYVPYSEDHSILEAYKTATNWSTYASRMQEEPQ